MVLLPHFFLFTNKFIIIQSSPSASLIINLQYSPTEKTSRPNKLKMTHLGPPFELVQSNPREADKDSFSSQRQSICVNKQ